MKSSEYIYEIPSLAVGTDGIVISDDGNYMPGKVLKLRGGELGVAIYTPTTSPLYRVIHNNRYIGVSEFGGRVHLSPSLDDRKVKKGKTMTITPSLYAREFFILLQRELDVLLVPDHILRDEVLFSTQMPEITGIGCELEGGRGLLFEPRDRINFTILLPFFSYHIIRSDQTESFVWKENNYFDSEDIYHQDRSNHVIPFVDPTKDYYYPPIPIGTSRSSIEVDPLFIEKVL